LPLIAQVDVAQPTTQIPVEQIDTEEPEPTINESPLDKPLELPDFKPEKGKEETLDLPVSLNTKKLDYKRKKGFSMTQKSTLINPGVLFEKRFAGKTAEIKTAAEEYGITVDGLAKFKRNMVFGTYMTKHDQVRVILQDHQAVDGDMILVKVNGEIIIPRVVLHGGLQTFTIGVIEGNNNMEFLALNQGESGPNTALITVYDEDGNVVPAKEWNLATGYLASFNIVRVPKEK